MPGMDSSQHTAGAVRSAPEQTRRLRIDFVSDGSCPWCAIGLAALEQALARLAPRIVADLHFQPFELDPEMPAQGVDAIAYLRRKYGLSEAQVRANGEVLRERGQAVGFAFDLDRRERIWNTFDAHRLLHWAGEVGADRQLALKKALFRAYFSEGLNPGDHEVLVRLAGAAGLDEAQARVVLESGRYAQETRAQEQRYVEAGVRSVPAVAINGQLAGCCAGRGVDEASLRAAGLGQP